MCKLTEDVQKKKELVYCVKERGKYVTTSTSCGITDSCIISIIWKRMKEDMLDGDSPIKSGAHLVKLVERAVRGFK
jgi:hypothetical protein